MKTKEKSAIITGGTRGIGKAIALKLAKKGIREIFLNYLENDDEANKTAEIINKLGGSPVLLKANLHNLSEIDHMFEVLKNHTKYLDIFVHSAALNTFKPLFEVKPNQWDLTVNINARGFLYVAQKCIPFMPEGGKMIAISSLGSQRFIPNYGAMGPTKAALESVVKILAVELADRGIQVNAVCGGLIQTDSIKKFPHYKSLIETTMKKIPAKRIGKPQDIAEVVAFLIDKSNQYIYGQTIIVDGGLSLM